ncbi:hypothetical protein [Facklamia sp. P12955]|uniref:hypothetical protein n=1 Tax=unclassified Facklamia TaxID=2622293 RepID=UPI003D179395
MKREKLETYLGKNVELSFFDGDVIRGVLKKSEYPKYYCCFRPIKSNTYFRTSHVKKIKELLEDK